MNLVGELEIARVEDGRFECWPDAFVADAFAAATNFDHARSEPVGDVEPVEDMGGVPEMLFDGRPIGRRPVRHHHLGAAHPAVAPGQQESRHGISVATGHNPDGFVSVGVDEHGHAAVAAAQADFVDQLHPAGAPATLRRHQIRQAGGQRHDVMPRQAVTVRHLADRHGVHVSDQVTGQTSGHMGAATDHDLGRVLPVPLLTVATLEATPGPHQGRLPSLGRQVANLVAAAVVHLVGGEPAPAAAAHPAGVGDSITRRSIRVHQQQHPHPSQA